MAVKYQKVVEEDLELGYGTVTGIDNPAGGTMTGSKVGLHTFSALAHIQTVMRLTATAMQEAIDALSVSAGEIVLPSGTYLFDSAITIPANITIRGLGAGTIIKAATGVGNLLNITGDYVIIENCAFDADSQGASEDKLIYVKDATGFKFVYGKVVNTAWNQYPIYLENVTDGLIQGSRFVGEGVVSARNNAAGLRFVNNYIDNSSATSYSMTSLEVKNFGASGGQSISDIVIQGNTCITKSGFCIEVGDFRGSNPVKNVSVIGNTCRVVNTTGVNPAMNPTLPCAAGGMSFIGDSNDFTDLVVSGNTIQMQDQHVDVGGIELGGIARASITGNTIYLGSVSATSVMQRGINVDDGFIYGNISGNTIYGIGTHAEEAGIMMTSQSHAYPINNNVISGNTIVAMAGDAGKGIYLRCTNSGADMKNNVVTGNQLYGPGTAAGTAIDLYEDGGGDIDNAVVTNNFVANWSTGIYHAATSASWIFANSIDETTVTTPYIGVYAAGSSHDLKLIKSSGLWMGEEDFSNYGRIWFDTANDDLIINNGYGLNAGAQIKLTMADTGNYASLEETGLWDIVGSGSGIQINRIATPDAPAADKAYIYLDTSGGKLRLMMRTAAATVQIATEP